ncbi:MAG: class I SAM-dependent methyltransferase [Phycisphaeraceae bacterium]|nr:class I SAM-dependent methyltransferase [Phycisphaeraceae bacterium]MCW5762512.1 class I SAM-dependent methyltransferase [Phycisphaeraceae bacterium]
MSGKPLYEFAATRDWPGYFAASAGRPPRETLLAALDLFEREGPIDAADPPIAVDLGCGEGRDTAELLRRGWRVTAIDGHEDAFSHLQNRTDIAAWDRLDMRLSPFEECQIPRCRLLNSSFSLPFCHPDSFDRLWRVIVAAIEPGGRFAGQFFGPRDSWAKLPDRSHQSRDEVEALLKAFQIEQLTEEEREGTDCTGAGKHWHVFHVVAKRV